VIKTCQGCGQIYDDRDFGMHLHCGFVKNIEESGARQRAASNLPPIDWSEMASLVKKVTSNSKKADSINKLIDKLVPPKPAPEVSQNREEKKCPDCAEFVLAEARICKHCRFRFE
jgi:hypothetical protein